MSLTLYQQPASDTYTSDNRNHAYLNSESEVYTCLSDNVTLTNYSYLFFIHTEDATLSKMKQPPWINSLGVTSVNEKLKSLYEYTFNPSITTATSIGDNRLFNYYMEVNEDFISESVTEDTGLFTKCNAFPVKRNDWNWKTYIMTNYAPGKFLSDFTGYRRVKATDYGTIQFLNGQFNETTDYRYISKVWTVRVNVYPTDGDIDTYNTYELTLTLAQRNSWSNYSSGETIFNDMSDRLVEFPAGPENINGGTRKWISQTIAGVTTVKNIFSLGDIIDSTTWKYEIYCYYYAGAGVEPITSEIVTYYLQSNCPDVQPVRLAWSNYLGGTDYFNFMLKSRKNLTVDRKSFMRNRLDVSNTTSSYPTYKGGQTIYDTEWTESYTITSDFLEAHESLGLESLWTSEDVFAFIGNKWYPIIIENSEVTIEDEQTITPIQYEVTFTKSNMGFGVADREINTTTFTSTPGGTLGQAGYVIN